MPYGVLAASEIVPQVAAQLLQTVSSIGTYRSVLLVAEGTPIDRFSSPDHLVSFSVAAFALTSSDTDTDDPHHGRIPQGAKRWGRVVLVSSIASHIRSSPDSSLGQFY